MNNNIYKLVWNKQINSLVPVSEIAKSKSKQSSSSVNKKSISKPKVLGLFVSSLFSGAGLTPSFAEICEVNQNSSAYSCNLLVNSRIENNISLMKPNFLGFTNFSTVITKPIDIGQGVSENIGGDKEYLLDGFDAVINGGGQSDSLSIDQNAKITIKAPDASVFASGGDVDLILKKGSTFSFFSKDSILLGKDINGKNSKGLGYVQIGEGEGTGNGAKLIIAGGLVNGKSNDGNPDSYIAMNGIGLHAYYDAKYSNPINLNLEAGSLIKSTDNGLEVYSASTGAKDVYIRNAGKIIAGIGATERPELIQDAPFIGSGVTVYLKTGGNANLDLEGGTIDAMYGVNLINGVGTLNVKGGEKGATIISDNPFIAEGKGSIKDEYNINLEGKIILIAKTDKAVIGKNFSFPGTTMATPMSKARVNTSNANIDFLGYKAMDWRFVLEGNGTINFGKGVASETTIDDYRVLQNFTGMANILDGYKVRIESVDGNTWNLGKNATLSFIPGSSKISMNQSITSDVTSTIAFEAGSSRTIEFSKAAAEGFKGFVNLGNNNTLTLKSDVTVFNAQLSGEGVLKVGSTVELASVNSFGGSVDITNGSQAIIKSSADNVTWKTNTSGILNFVGVKEGKLGKGLEGSGTVQLTGSSMTLNSALTKFTQGTFNVDSNSSLTLDGFSTFTNILKGDGALVAKNNGTPLIIEKSGQLKDFTGTITASDNSTIKLNTILNSNIGWDTSNSGTLIFEGVTGDFGRSVKGKGTVALDGSSSMTANSNIFGGFTGNLNLISANSRLNLGDITNLNNNVSGNGTLIVNDLTLNKKDQLKDFKGTVDVTEGSKVEVANAGGNNTNWKLNTTGTLSFNNVKDGNLGASISGGNNSQLNLVGSSLTSNQSVINGFTGGISLDGTSALTLEGLTTVKNKMTGTGKLTVDSKGSAFSVGDNLTDFAGILALKNSNYTLDDKVTKLKLEMGQGNITTVGNTNSNTLVGLAFNGGTMVFDSKTSKQITVGNGIDLTNKGTLKLTNIDAISVPGVEPGGSYSADSLMSIDEGETVQTIVTGELAGASSASNISLVDENGNGFSPDKEVAIKQGDEAVATGKFGLSLATKNTKNGGSGLFVNYSLTEVDIHEGKNIALVSSEASSTLSLQNDLSAKITGKGGVSVNLNDKDHVVSISNTGNDYLGETLVNKGTLYVGKNAKTGLGDTIIGTEGTLKSAGIIGGNLMNQGVVDITQLSYAENKAQAFNANPSLTLRVEKDLTNEGTIYVDRNNLGSGNTLSIGGDLKNDGVIYLSNQNSHFAGNSLLAGGDYIAQNASNIYLNATATGDQDKIKIAGNVTRQDEGVTTLYVTDTGRTDSVGSDIYNKITLIEVGGNSEEGAFILGNDVFLGSYQYLLSAENNKDWVLTSYLPPVEPDPIYPIDPIKPIDPVKPPVEPTPIIRVDLGNYMANIQSMVKSQLSSLGSQGGGSVGAGGLSRSSRFDNAVWTTTSHDQMKGNQTGSEQIDFDYKYYSTNFGADHQFSLSNGQGVKIGIMAGTSKSDTTSKNKITHSESSGSVKGIMAGIYGSWYLEEENTLSPFIDVTLTYDQYKNTVETKGNASVRYNSNIANFSLQGGYPILVASNLVLEPQAQISYLNYSADEFTDHTGTKIKLDLKGNTMARVGAYLYPEQGNIKPYAGLNVWFDNTRTEVSFNDQTFKSKDNNGFAYEAKVGVAGNVTTNFNLSGELNYRKNADKSDKWGVNIGLKYQF